MSLLPHDFRGARWDFTRPLVMGVLNVTPDSFSDGGQLDSIERVLLRAEEMIEAGADCLDIGGESTRPGAPAVSATEETRRLVPVLEALAKRFDIPLSVDTSKAMVARHAVEAGAEIVNDVSGGRFDREMLATVSALETTYICGHVTADTLAKVHESLCESAREVCDDLAHLVAGMPATLRQRVIVDPCLGFGKTLACNIELMHGGRALREQVDLPVLIGASRKRFLGELTGRAVDERDVATAASSIAAMVGGAQIVRVHDVGMTCDALRVFFAKAENGAHG